MCRSGAEGQGLVEWLGSARIVVGLGDPNGLVQSRFYGSIPVKYIALECSKSICAIASSQKLISL